MINPEVQIQRQIREERKRLRALESKYSVASRYNQVKSIPKKTSGKIKRLQEALARLRETKR